MFQRDFGTTSHQPSTLRRRRLSIERLESRAMLSALPLPTGANEAYQPTGGFSTLQYNPHGELAQLMWVGHSTVNYNLPTSRMLLYRTRDAAGVWSQDIVLAELPYYGKSEGEQLLFESDGTPNIFLIGISPTQTENLLTRYRRGPQGWELFETVPLPNQLGLGFEPSLVGAVGGNDSFHLVTTTYDWDMGAGLYYFTNVSGTWQTSPITLPVYDDPSRYYHSSYTPRFLSVAADVQGKAHLAYTPEFINAPNPNGTLRSYSEVAYASNSTGSWVSELVHRPGDDSGDSGLGSSIAIAPNGTIAIANTFIDRVSTGSPINSVLIYNVRQSAGVWTRETVASSADGYIAGDGNQGTGFAPHLLFDSESRPHIAFADHASQHFPFTGADEFAGQIRHATKSGNSWSLQTVFVQRNPVINQLVDPLMAIVPGGLVFTGMRQEYSANLSLNPHRYFPTFVEVARGGVLPGVTPLVQFAVREQTVVEASIVVTVQVQMSFPRSSPITVPLSFSGTAQSVSDYVASTTSVVIPAGQTTATFTLTIVDNAIAEGDESVLVDLGPLNGAKLGERSRFRLSIIDNDNPAGITQHGGVITIRGTGGDDFVVIDATLPDYIGVLLNGSGQQYLSANIDEIVFHDVGGQDQTIVVTRAGRDVIDLAEGRIQIQGVGYSILLTGTERNYIYGDPLDEATFRDTPDNDVFYGLSSYAIHIGPDLRFLNQTIGVLATHVDGSAGGNDTAVLVEAGGGLSEEFYGRPGKSTFLGHNFSYVIDGFESTYVFGGTGDDYAEFLDDLSNDIFYGLPIYSILVGPAGVAEPRFFLEVINFARVVAISSAGHDLMVMYDSPEDDSLTVEMERIELRNFNFSIETYTFQQQFLYMVAGGHDFVQMFGTFGTEHFYAAADLAAFFYSAGLRAAYVYGLTPNDFVGVDSGSFGFGASDTRQLLAWDYLLTFDEAGMWIDV